MTTMIRIACGWLITGLWPAAAADTPKPAKPAISENHYRIYRADGQSATLNELAEESAKSTVTFLGESHDDAVAHYLEEKILRLVHRPDLALSLEMFEADVQYVLDEYLAGLITEEHLIASGRAWKSYKSDYRPLIEFAKEHKMLVLASNAPRRYVNRVSRLGAASLTGLSSQARAFLPPLPYAEASAPYAAKFLRVMEEAQKEQEKSSDAKHAQPPPDPAKALQAQSLWDADMAFSIASLLTRNPGTRVLHCSGSFHSAEKLGVPEHLLRYRPGTSILVVTIIPGKSFPKFDDKNMRGQGDFVIVTDPNPSHSAEHSK